MTLLGGIPDQALPLCPNVTTGGGVNPLHATANGILDAFYAAADLNADSEFTSPSVARAYEAAAGQADERMPLYREQVAVPDGNYMIVTAYYFRCKVCGFTLPATATTAPR